MTYTVAFRPSISCKSVLTLHKAVSFRGKRFFTITLARHMAVMSRASPASQSCVGTAIQDQSLFTEWSICRQKSKVAAQMRLIDFSFVQATISPPTAPFYPRFWMDLTACRR